MTNGIIVLVNWTFAQSKNVVVLKMESILIYKLQHIFHTDRRCCKTKADY